MPNTPNRNYRLPEDSDIDWRDVINDLARDVDADVANLVANGTGGGGTGGGAGGAMVYVVNVPANQDAWTDTGIVLGAGDALVLEATGAISHNAGPDPLYGPTEGVAELRIVVVPDGTTPVGDVAGQISYRVQRVLVNKVGRVLLWIRDVGGKGDNRGSFTVTLTLYQGGTATIVRLLVQLTA